MFTPSIRSKLLIAFLAITLLSTVLIGSISFITSRNALESEAFAGIEALRETRLAQIQFWLDAHRRNVGIIAENPTVSTSIRAFTNAVNNRDVVYGNSRSDSMSGIQQAYAAHPDLVDAGDQSIYTTSHNRFHDFYRDTVNLYGYSDLLLVEDNGDVLYSVAKNNEFMTSLLTGPYRHTALSDAFRRTVATRNISVTDLIYYEPAGEPVMFFTAPILFNDRLLGVLVIEVPSASIGDILAGTGGLGETGESYIVGNDLMFRSESRFVEELGVDTTILNPGIQVNTVATRLAINRHVDTQVIDGYRDVRVLSAWTPVEVLPSSEENPEGIVWALVVEKEFSEVVQPANDLLVTLVGIGVVITVTILAVAFILSGQISSPITQLTHTANRIASGQLDQRVVVDATDEVGVLANAFNSMADQLKELINNLEERVSARTRDLEIAANVSKQAVSVLDLNDLLPGLAESTRDGFGLYHVSVFLYEPETRTLHLKACTEKRATGVIFDVDKQGIAACAARSGELVLANDVRESPDYYYSELLPDTASEIALPMKIGKRIIGVLDLQSSQAGYFRQEDLRVLTSLAEQIAIAVRNAQLFSELQEARKEAETANQAKSYFLATMSHELRTPLNGILNFTRFVADGMFGEVNPKQEETLRKAFNNGKHLLALINDVLDISKIESGTLRLFVEDDIDLKAELLSIVQTGNTLLKDKPVDIRSVIDRDLPRVRGDRRRIRQIVYNVVANACKFTEEGEIVVRATADEDEVLITVSDTGPGIASEDHAAVFEVFTQTESGIRQGEGTGLGMPISRKLAEAHGGRLWLESAPDEGATFYVVLPIASRSLKPTLGGMVYGG
ncbi:MAG: ATP-binding protein [Chloroflexi bacterium]|nr:ATP-binding protein [Chloroflexota bacterium]